MVGENWLILLIVKPYAVMQLHGLLCLITLLVQPLNLARNFDLHCLDFCSDREVNLYWLSVRKLDIFIGGGRWNASIIGTSDGDLLRFNEIHTCLATVHEEFRINERLRLRAHQE